MSTPYCQKCAALRAPGEPSCSSCGAARPQRGWPEDDLIGETLGGRFQVEGLIGRGGFGAVYTARHVSLGGRRAIKVMRPDLADDDTLVERFRREAQTLYRLKAPQLVKVEDFGCHVDGRPYIVMELVDGVRLDALIRYAGGLEVLRAIRIGREITLALAEAHEAQVLHRDLKAENVMIVATGAGERVKVLDLGVSFILGERQRLTRASRAIGTPEYMSPEQWAGSADIDERADIYALGVLLYEMLAGDVPFPRGERGPSAVYQAMMGGRAPLISKLRGDLPPGLEGLVFRMMARDREVRPRTAMEALEELERVRTAMRLA
jgi:serine/threonine protein kinase